MNSDKLETPSKAMNSLQLLLYPSKSHVSLRNQTINSKISLQSFEEQKSLQPISSREVTSRRYLAINGNKTQRFKTEYSAQQSKQSIKIPRRNIMVESFTDNQEVETFQNKMHSIDQIFSSHFSIPIPTILPTPVHKVIQQNNLIDIKEKYNRNNIPYKIQPELKYKLECHTHEFYYFTVTTLGKPSPIYCQTNISEIKRQPQKSLIWHMSYTNPYPSSFNYDHYIRSEAWKIHDKNQSNIFSTQDLYFSVCAETEFHIELQISFTLQTDSSRLRGLSSIHSQQTIPQRQERILTFEEIVEKRKRQRLLNESQRRHLPLLKLPVDEKIQQVQQKKAHIDIRFKINQKIVAFKKQIREFKKFTEGPNQIKKKKAQMIQYTWLRSILVVCLLKRLSLNYKKRYRSIRISYYLTVLVSGMSRRINRLLASKAPTLTLRVKIDIASACRMIARQIRVKNTFTAAHLLKPYIDTCISSWSLRGKFERFNNSVIKIQRTIRKFLNRYNAFKKTIRQLIYTNINEILMVGAKSTHNVRLMEKIRDQIFLIERNPLEKKTFQKKFYKRFKKSWKRESKAKIKRFMNDNRLYNTLRKKIFIARAVEAMTSKFRNDSPSPRRVLNIDKPKAPRIFRPPSLAKLSAELNGLL